MYRVLKEGSNVNVLDDTEPFMLFNGEWMEGVRRWAGRKRHLNNERCVKKLYDGASGKGADDRPCRRWMDKTD